MQRFTHFVFFVFFVFFVDKLFFQD